MKVISQSIIYDNPIPQLRSRQGMFPCLFKCEDGRIASVFVIGEAFESADKTSYISFSADDGKTWTSPEKMYDKSKFDRPFSDCSKVVSLPDGTLLALGYGFWRDNPDLPLGNPETGGLIDDFVFSSLSKDCGRTWNQLSEIKCSWGPHVEASAPVTVLNDGTLITPITGFPDWEGKMHGDWCGKALRSEDGGKSWSDDVTCMKFDEKVTCYEQRMCQLESGTIVNIAWCENVDTGERLCNHYTYSSDNGKTWSKPESTNVMGQASSVCAIGGEKLLALHAMRRDTDRPGVYAYVIDFSEKTWKIVDECIIWEPQTPVVRDKNMAEIFAFLKFGQPSAILLDENTVLATHWYCEQGQYRPIAIKITLN